MWTPGRCIERWLAGLKKGLKVDSMSPVAEDDAVVQIDAPLKAGGVVNGQAWITRGRVLSREGKPWGRRGARRASAGPDQPGGLMVARQRDLREFWSAGDGGAGHRDRGVPAGSG